MSPPRGACARVESDIVRNPRAPTKTNAPKRAMRFRLDTVVFIVPSVLRFGGLVPASKNPSRGSSNGCDPGHKLPQCRTNEHAGRSPDEAQSGASLSSIILGSIPDYASLHPG